MESGLDSEQRRALALLATAAHNGATQPLLSAHGFGVPMIAALVDQGLVSLTREEVSAGGKMVEVSKVRITEAGREALAAGQRLHSVPGNERGDPKVAP